MELNSKKLYSRKDLEILKEAVKKNKNLASERGKIEQLAKELGRSRKAILEKIRSLKNGKKKVKKPVVETESQTVNETTFKIDDEFSDTEISIEEPTVKIKEQLERKAIEEQLEKEVLKEDIKDRDELYSKLLKADDDEGNIMLLRHIVNHRDSKVNRNLTNFYMKRIKVMPEIQRDTQKAIEFYENGLLSSAVSLNVPNRRNEFLFSEKPVKCLLGYK